MKSAEYKVGLVGLGEISSYFIHACNLNPKTKVVAVCRRKPLDGAEKEKYKEFKYYSDWKDLVDDPNVNCIIIATPPSTHAPITLHALQQKKRVISEKPFSTVLEDAHKCIEVAKSMKTHLNFAYHASMNPLSLAAKKVVRSQLDKGDAILTINILMQELVTNYHSGQSWIFDPAISGGGVLIDSGVNAISVAQFVCGNVSPTHVELVCAPNFKVETSCKVNFVGVTHPELKGELVQNWLHPGEESRSFDIGFRSGVKISFCFAKGSITITQADGKSHTDQVINKNEADHHLTPMSLEYINVVNFAVDQFQTQELVDELAEGPFEFVMKCYEMNKKKQ